MNRTNITYFLVGLVIIGTIWKGGPEPTFPWSVASLKEVLEQADGKIILADFETEW